MVKSFKCPGCGANMHYDADKQKMYCDFCETEVEVDHIDEGGAGPEAESEENIHKADFKMYSCPSCGAELLTDEHTSATFCNFCGSANLLEDRLTGELMPAQLIPFKLGKEKAKSLFRAWTRKGLFTPVGFRSQSTIEKISGIYVPFWLYDYHTRAYLEATCTRVRREVIGDTELIHTDNFRVIRDVDTEYLKVPADASKKMPDDIMDKLEPFNYNEMIKFTMPYLSGYLAEKFNYTSEELANRVETRVNDYIYQAARETIHGYTSVNVVNSDINLNRENSLYTLLPVWMLNYRYKNQNYTFAINGQTGRIVGKLPVSKGKAVLWFFLVSIVSTAIITLIGGL